MMPDRWVRIGAIAGIVGAPLFGGVLVGLTIAEYDFMRGLGWSPLLAPTFDWPSGLALGPLGWIMTGTFILTGLLVALFGFGLRRALKSSRSGRVAGALLLVAGAALACLASPTDPTLRSTPATLHGMIHDLSYVVLGLSLFPAMLALGLAFRKIANWRGLARWTYLTAALVLPCFALKGIAIYLLLAAALVWFEAVAWRLHKAG